MACCLFLTGVILIVGPVLQNSFNSRNRESTLRKYNLSLQKTDLEEEKEKARRYNEKLRENSSYSPEEYIRTLNITDGILGILCIPKINLELPIYHGIEDEVLAKGAGHMPNSSFPLAESGTHTVLTGHTGYPGAELFTNLTQLEVGDEFQLLVLDEILIYRVDQIKIVLPDQLEGLSPVLGQDYCTLVTCTPYGVNSHRLLVRGKREQQEKAPREQGSLWS